MLATQTAVNYIYTGFEEDSKENGEFDIEGHTKQLHT